MAGAIPGAIPRHLKDRSVQLFRADERVFEAMVDGWTSQMLARGLQTSSIEPKLSLIRRFQNYTGTYPWSWGPADLDEFLAEHRLGERAYALSTLRAYSNAIAAFCGYVANIAYGWGDYCEAMFGEIPAQIVFEWNSPRHTADDARDPRRRAFTVSELQALFDHIDDQVDFAYRKRLKQWPALMRNSTAFKVGYAFGLRRRELAMLEISDFGPNPHVPDYGLFGALTVRWGKGTKGSGPRRRTVLTVPEFEWVVPLLSTWLSPGRRDRFKTADRSSALWPTERGRVAVSTVGDAFVALRRAVGYDEGLNLHCLRHSYVTHLLEAGYDATFVQTQVGHRHASTTSLYTSVGSDFKQKILQQMISTRIVQREEHHDE